MKILGLFFLVVGVVLLLWALGNELLKRTRSSDSYQPCGCPQSAHDFDCHIGFREIKEPPKSPEKQT